MYFNIYIHRGVYPPVTDLKLFWWGCQTSIEYILNGFKS